MVSPELLRRFPYFGFMTDAQLRAVAMLTDVAVLAPGETLVEAETHAECLHILTEGSLDLVLVVIDREDERLRKEFGIGEVNPGDIVDVGPLIEPYVYTATARAAKACELLQVEARQLREMCDADLALAHGLMREAAKSAMIRLQYTRVQLAAARG